MAANVTIAKLVKEVKEAILRAQEQLDQASIAITKVDLELKTSLQKSGGVDAKFALIPVEVSGKYTTADVHTIGISLVPEPGLELMGNVHDELADAIKVITATVQEAANSTPRFRLDEATLSLNMTVTKEGKIAVIIGGKGETSSGHTIKLTLSQQKR